MVAVGPKPATVLHITALVERSAHIVWGSRLIGPAHPLPDEVNDGFANIYGYLRQNPL
jgi:L-fuculose-phosphate aldolase